MRRLDRAYQPRLPDDAQRAARSRKPEGDGRKRRRIAVIYRRTDDLKPSPANPRTHSPAQIAHIAASIEAFGFNVPLLANAADEIVAGHGRWLAAKKLGLAEVPTIRLDHLSAAQAKAFRIADNRLTEIATWDDRLLAEQLKQLAELNLDFDLEATGFSMAEIDLRIENLAPRVAGDDAVDEVPAEMGPPVCQEGDLWLLGPHRLLCANALDGQAFDTLMAGEAAAMAFTDPPYNVRIQGHVSGRGAIHHREFAMATGEMSRAEFRTFLTQITGHLACHSRDGSLHYLFIDWRHVEELLAAGRASYTSLENLCVWTKTNAGLGSLYRSQHELIPIFKKGDAAHRNNVQLGTFGRNRTNVWIYPGGPGFSRGPDDDEARAVHPTVKPVALVVDAILDVSARQEIILDPFVGSGTTVIAAERTGRRCFGMEIDPLYVDAAIRRWQRLTGSSAVHAGSQRCFADIEAERQR
jgi:DNA modification methylase